MQRTTDHGPRTASPRSGLSLTEVLIAMGILTIGLLGVASVFPVGSFYMQKAEIADRGSAIAQSVMSDIIARGMLNPGTWFVQVPFPAAPATAPTSPNYFFSGIDGKYVPLKQPVASASVSATFTRPLAEALSEGLNRTLDMAVLAKQFGHAYVIDPMFAAAASNTVPTKFNVTAYPFPATAYTMTPWPSSTYYGVNYWDPWRAASRTSGEKVWPIRRVTFQDSTPDAKGLPGWPMNTRTAEHFCRANDDLTTDLPPRDDRPAIQDWEYGDTNQNGKPDAGEPAMARQWNGDYSWIVTVLPTTNAARNGMARNPESFAYDVSVVVFYKRTLPTAVPQANQDMQDAASNERMVGAKIISTGPNGGELLLSEMLINGFGDVTDSSGKDVNPFDQLKTGQWIMLCGPHPNSSTAEPRFVLNWYQIQSIEKESTTGLYINPVSQRIVSVRGPQWPWQPRLSYPAGQQGSDVAKLSDDLCVGIFRGAVAVHTKTLRLESSLASGYGAGMPLVTPPGVTSPTTVPH